MVRFRFRLGFLGSEFNRMLIRQRIMLWMFRNRVRIRVTGLLCLTLFAVVGFIGFIIWCVTPNSEYTVIGTDAHPSVLHLLRSEISMHKIELLPPCQNCFTPTTDGTDVKAKQTIGVFIVFDSVEGFSWIHSRHRKDISSNEAFINCNALYDYAVFIVYRSDIVKIDTIPRTIERISKVPAWINRLLVFSLEECRTRGVNVTTWMTVISSERNLAHILNDILIETYLGSVTWYDILIWSDHGNRLNEVNFRKWSEEPVQLLSRNQENIGVVVGQKLGCCGIRIFFHQCHYEIFGHFLPLNNWTLALSVHYLIKLYSPQWLINVQLRPNNLSETVAESITNESSDTLDTLSTNSSYYLHMNEVLGQNFQILERYAAASNKAKQCLRCDLLNRRNEIGRVIAMSLYGDDPKYSFGAVRNAQLLPVVFPGWRLWIYCASLSQPESGVKDANNCASVPLLVTRKLVELGAEMKYVESGRLAPMLWRFLPVDDASVDVFLSRDADSRLTERDAVVVSAWLDKDSMFHCIRDHPSHANYPISGGMWGARTKWLKMLLGDRSIASLMKQYTESYFEDMNFLSKEMWPAVQPYTYCHDSVSCDRWPQSHPFPIARRGLEHLGQVFDEHSFPRQIDVDILIKSQQNLRCEPERIIGL